MDTERAVLGFHDQVSLFDVLDISNFLCGHKKLRNSSFFYRTKCGNIKDDIKKFTIGYYFWSV